MVFNGFFLQNGNNTGQATIVPPAKYHSNGVHWQADSDPLLQCLPMYHDVSKLQTQTTTNKDMEKLAHFLEKFICPFIFLMIKHIQ